MHGWKENWRGCPTWRHFLPDVEVSFLGNLKPIGHWRTWPLENSSLRHLILLFLLLLRLSYCLPLPTIASNKLVMGWNCLLTNALLRRSLIWPLIVPECNFHVGFKRPSTNVGLTRGKTWGGSVVCRNREPSTIYGSLNCSFQLHTQANIRLYLAEATRYFTMVTILYNTDLQLYNICASAKIYMKKMRSVYHNLEYLWVIGVYWHGDIRRSRRRSFQNIHLTAHHSDISVQMKQVTKLDMPTVKICEPC